VILFRVLSALSGRPAIGQRCFVSSRNPVFLFPKDGESRTSRRVALSMAMLVSLEGFHVDWK